MADKKIFAFQSVDYINGSTSGGAFISIAKDFIAKRNGVVYGAIINSNNQIVHERACTIEECEWLRGSKYVRSDVTVSYKGVIDDLLQNKNVLYVGTPCQIYSLKTILNKKNCNIDNLYTIDLVCNGAPLPKVWNDYVEWLECKMKSKLITFVFRTKIDNKNPYLSIAKFEHDKTIYNNPYVSAYNRLFLKKLIIPKNCFSCMYKQSNRVGDITLGDFWGHQYIFKNFFDNNGVSQVIVNTTKGEELMNGLYCEKNKIVENFGTEYLKYQHNLVGETKIPEEYNEFWDAYKKKGFDFVAKKYGNCGRFCFIEFYLRKFLRNLGIIEFVKKYLKF